MANGGPNTSCGKAASSRNALKHGLLSEAPITTRYEKPAEWEAHRAAILADLQPRDHAELCLAERAALLHWRLRRVPLAEAELFDREAAEQSRHYSSPSNARRDAIALLPAMNALERLTRYEAHLGRELARTLKALHDLQSRPIEAAKAENCETNSPPPAPPTGTEPRSSAPTPPRPLLAAPVALGPVSQPPFHRMLNLQQSMPPGRSAPEFPSVPHPRIYFPFQARGSSFARVETDLSRFSTARVTPTRCSQNA